MKKLAIIAACAVLASCEKVIDVDLNSGDPQTVVEANLAAGADSLEVRITQTANYFGTADPATINDAQVSLVSLGNRINATPQGNGIYRISNINATADVEYTLEVSVDGALTTATSYMPPAVVIDSVYFQYEEDGFFEPGFRPYLAFQDPPETENFYRILILINGEYDGEIRLGNDKFSNGEYQEIRFPFLELESGDELRIELRSIDEKVYTYYETLDPISGGGGQPGIAPGNPVTNLEGPIQLGYFGTYSSDEGSAVKP